MPPSHLKLSQPFKKGHIELDEMTVSFMDTPQFQRLRDLKQLGSAYFVFPGASHNRFEHSIGVSHLSGTLVKRFKMEQPELDIDETDVIARPELNWSHEQGSEMMLDDLIADNAIEAPPDSNFTLGEREIKFIKNLIQGDREKHYNPEKMFLFDIVANKRNSVDVDKFDYLLRDCFNLGMKSSYDPTRLMTFSRVIDNEICFYHKESFNLYEMFQTRYSIFKRIYTHKTSKAIEYMLTDAMLAADPFLHISDRVEDPKQYVHLTDSIITEIERSKDDQLRKSREIIRRLRKRDLYVLADQFPVTPQVRRHLGKEVITAAKIARCQDPYDKYGVDGVAPFTADDVIVEWLPLSYTMGDKDPVEMTKFYNKIEKDKSFTLKRWEVSSLLPENFEDIFVRVYSRDRTKQKAVQKAVRRWVDEYNSQLGVKSTPIPGGSSNGAGDVDGRISTVGMDEDRMDGVPATPGSSVISTPPSNRTRNFLPGVSTPIKRAASTRSPQRITPSRGMQIPENWDPERSPKKKKRRDDDSS
ncbi:SAM domain and HD [Quaeritorhiza haematococci]|nr:SAM domain and HD [Quaeritorhiza haematococci]